MDFLLKSSVVIVIFYLCYKLFLQRETFFVGNRWFLLSGILLSIIIPFIIIPVYVEYSMPFDTIITTSNVTTPLPIIENSFDMYQFMTWLYLSGFLVFMGKFVTGFISLFLLIRKHRAKEVDSLNYIETTTDLAPFSFFNWIVYNPNHFETKEMTLIINHEKVHAKQYHSIDIIVAQLACILLWFNPIVWLYKKALQQNLEFIADQEAQTIASCEKTYQNLLLKTSISSRQLALTNNFYNSLIKKRIVMLHKSKSNKMNAFKYALVLPLLVVFIFNFNTETIAQTKSPQAEKVIIGQNVLKYVITKDTKDTQLESIKEKMAENDVTIVYKDLMRNDKKEITDIRIKYDSKKGSGEFYVNSDEPIKDIAITLNVNENILTVSQAMKNMSQSFEIITDEDGDKKVKTSSSGENIFVYSIDDDEDNDNKVIVVGKDGKSHEVEKEKNVYVFKSASVKDSEEADDVAFIKKNKNDTVWIKKNVKNIVWTDDDGKDLTKKIGTKGKNGVIYIKTKDDASLNGTNQIIAVGDDRGDRKVMVFTSEGENPLYLLDGKEITKKEFDAIEPEQIDKMEVYKGDTAIEKYGKKAKDGVIEITTKKKG